MSSADAPFIHYSLTREEGGRKEKKDLLARTCYDLAFSPLYHYLLQHPSMSLWSRQQAAPVAVASAVGLLFAATAVRSLFHSPSPRILKAPEPSEEAPYKYSLYEGGSVLQTPYGKLRYYELGPEDGKRVLLIHGISTPCPVWQRLIPKLVESGHRVLCYDLVGRGYSDGPADIQYNESVYISQLCFLLTALPAWSGSFNIIGYSMGGTIATKFASYFPERVDKLLLISPAGFIKSQDLPWYENSIRIGYLHIKLARSLLSNGIVTSHFLNLTDLLKWQSKNHKGFIHSFTVRYRG
jgi:alpha/beta superfamily hydrolase